MVCDLIKSQQSWAVLGLPCVFQPKQVAQPSAEGRYWPMCMLALGLFTLRTCKYEAHSSLLHCAPSESWLKCRQDCSFNKSIYRVWINLPAYFHVTDLGTSQLGEGVSVLWGHCWRWEIIAFFLRSKVTSQTCLPSFEILISHKSPCHSVKQWADPPVCSVQIYACWDSLPWDHPSPPLSNIYLKKCQIYRKDNNAMNAYVSSTQIQKLFTFCHIYCISLYVFGEKGVIHLTITWSQHHTLSLKASIESPKNKDSCLHNHSFMITPMKIYNPVRSSNSQSVFTQTHKNSSIVTRLL